MTISIEKKVSETLPELILGGFLISVEVEQSSNELLTLMDDELKALEPVLTPESIREMATVKANKKAYKALGKDPNRYRPSAESLLRRVANGKGLYHINNVVDILNLISVKTGYSICGYDYNTVEGAVALGKGMEGEPYEGIGRGELNIENLPVFRDEKGAFGTPTSDSVRTMVTDNTKQFLMIIIGFDDQKKIEAALDEASSLYSKFAKGEEKERFFIHNANQ
nr:phenylalanine--tRNA ligase beta subunit-related protein [uncultured Carboxylicivirga sp.]